MSADDLSRIRAQIEAWKAQGGVVVGGVRFTRASNLDEAFELGRLQENDANTHYRVALRDVARLLGYDEFAFNEKAVLAFVEWVLAGTGKDAQTKRAELAERKLRDQMDLARQVRDLLWQGRPGQPGLTTPRDINAIVDAVRVLLESARNYESDTNAVRRDNAGLRGENAGLRQRATTAEQRASNLQMQVEAMKEALATERDRGYRAALSDVRKAAKKIKEDRA